MRPKLRGTVESYLDWIYIEFPHPLRLRRRKKKTFPQLVNSRAAHERHILFYFILFFYLFILFFYTMLLDYRAAASVQHPHKQTVRCVMSVRVMLRNESSDIIFWGGWLFDEPACGLLPGK